MNTYLNKILNTAKKIVVSLIIFSTLTANMSFADCTEEYLSHDDYFKFTTASGKSIEVDLSTVTIDKDVVTFTIKYYRDTYKHFNKVSINLKDKTVKKIRHEQYNYRTKELTYAKDYPKTENFKPINNGETMSELYEIATILKYSADAFSENPDIWRNYFTDIQNNIYKKYHPNLLRWKELSNEDFNSLSNKVNLTIMLDRNGNILSYQCSRLGIIYITPAPKNADFDTKFDYYVKNIFDKTKFPPLPKQYKGDKLIIRFNISFNTEEDNSSYKEIYKGGGSTIIMMEKNSSPAITVPIYMIKGAKNTAVFTGKTIKFAACTAGIAALMPVFLIVAPFMQ